MRGREWVGDGSGGGNGGKGEAGWGGGVVDRSARPTYADV